jgi:hypothetical protein
MASLKERLETPSQERTKSYAVSSPFDFFVMRVRSDEMDDKEFLDSIEPKPGVRVRFGLEAQGHIPTVERMLDEGCCWPEINRAIGWAGDAAEKNYMRHLRRKHKAAIEALNAVKSWDIDQSMNHGLGISFALTHELREKVQAVVDA